MATARRPLCHLCLLNPRRSLTTSIHPHAPAGAAAAAAHKPKSTPSQRRVDWSSIPQPSSSLNATPRSPPPQSPRAQGQGHSTFPRPPFRPPTRTDLDSTPGGPAPRYTFDKQERRRQPLPNIARDGFREPAAPRRSQGLFGANGVAAEGSNSPRGFTPRQGPRGPDTPFRSNPGFRGPTQENAGRDTAPHFNRSSGPRSFKPRGAFDHHASPAPAVDRFAAGSRDRMRPEAAVAEPPAESFDPFAANDPFMSASSSDYAEPDDFSRPSKRKDLNKKRDAEKALLRSKKEKPQVVLSKAALEKKAMKAEMVASGEMERRAREEKVRRQRELAIPGIVSVGQLAQLTNRKLFRLQALMQTIGHDDLRPDRMLQSDDAALIALECGFEPIVDETRAFDIYPSPPAVDPSKNTAPPTSSLHHGPRRSRKNYIVGFVKVDFGGCGRSWGITQHIGAFEVALADLIKGHGKKEADKEGPQTITFLDTPGHAAFSEMRSRGATVTDVAVIVVAADDGVKPQTKEVIDLVKASDVGVVVAITKCDKPGVDLHKVRSGIYAAGIEIEAMGGEVPCVEVSAVSRQGLDELVETIAAVAEVRDLRAEKEGVRFEGRIIESDVGRERGNVTTVLVLRGTLEAGCQLIAGHAHGRARQLFSASGQTLERAYPGQPVEVTGWKSLPEAGSEVLQADSEEDAKRAVENRVRRKEQQVLLAEVEKINEKRAMVKETQLMLKEETKGMSDREAKALLRDKEAEGRLKDAEEEKVKELRLVIKADFTGTMEAVVGALAPLGNEQVKVKVVSSGVGDVTESDVKMAAAAEGAIVGFNVAIDRAAYPILGMHQIPCYNDTVIYRLIDLVKDKLIALLPKRFDDRVSGEATILQAFNITLKGRHTKKIAGCRVGNGEFKKADKVRVMRGQKLLWEGPLEQLKQGKKDAASISKGTECGMAFAEFEDFEVDDKILAVQTVEVERTLTDGL